MMNKVSTHIACIILAMTVSPAHAQSGAEKNGVKTNSSPVQLKKIDLSTKSITWEDPPLTPTPPTKLTETQMVLAQKICKNYMHCNQSSLGQKHYFELASYLNSLRTDKQNRLAAMTDEKSSAEQVKLVTELDQIYTDLNKLVYTPAKYQNELLISATSDATVKNAVRVHMERPFLPTNLRSSRFKVIPAEHDAGFKVNSSGKSRLGDFIRITEDQRIRDMLQQRTNPRHEKAK